MAIHFGLILESFNIFIALLQGLKFSEIVSKAKELGHKADRGARGRFLAGVVYGFGEQLEQQQEESEETGLVWVGDPQLNAWVGRRHRQLRSGRRLTMRADGVWSRGRMEGRNLRLHRAIEKR